MILKKIKIQNIRSYENQEIEFPQGSVLLSGDIGAGKTSVLLAIEFALFGLQPSQRGSSLLKNGKKEAKVILELEVDGKEVVLEKTLRKSKKTVTQDSASISIDNERFEGSVTEVKTRVLKLLNYPHEFAKKTNLLYKFTVYTPQEEMKQIIMESAENRLNTLRHIFGMAKYKRIEENVSVFTSKLREKIRLEEGRLLDIEDIKKNLENKKLRLIDLEKNKFQEKILLQGQRKKREEKETETQELEKKIKEKQNLEREKEKAELMLRNKKDNFLELKNQISRLTTEIEEGKKIIFDEKKLAEFRETIERNKEKEKYFQEKVINISSQSNSLNERKKEALHLKEKISNLSTCPTCLQEVNDSYKSNIFQKIESEILEVDKKNQEISSQKLQITGELESLRKQVSVLEEKKSEEEIKKIKLENIKEKERNLREIELKKESMGSDVEMMLKHVTFLGEEIKKFSKYSTLFEDKQKELDQEKLKERQHEIKVAETEKEFSLIREQIAEIEKQISEKEKLREKVNYLKSLEGWLSDNFLNLILTTEKNVMLKLREEFSKLFSEWFSILVPEYLSVRLDEKFSPVIQQQDYDISYNFLSGGERTSVALAYRLALNQVINSLLSKIKTRGLIILDEPTDGFSESQLDKMRDVLTQLNVNQLILVSHEAKIESFVENIVKLRKEDGMTKVEK